MSRPSKAKPKVAPKPWAPKRKASGLDLECARPAKTARTQDEMPSWQDFIDSLPSTEHVALLSKVIKDAVEVPGPGRDLVLRQLSLHSDRDPWTLLQWHKAVTTYYHKKATSTSTTCETKVRTRARQRLEELVGIAPAHLFAWSHFSEVLRHVATSALLEELATSWIKTETASGSVCPVWLTPPLVDYTERYASTIMDTVIPKIELLRWLFSVEPERKMKLKHYQSPRLEAQGLRLVLQDSQSVSFNARGCMLGVQLDFENLERRRFMRRLGPWLAGALVSIEVRSRFMYSERQVTQHRFEFDQTGAGLCLKPVAGGHVAGGEGHKWEPAAGGKKVMFGQSFTVTWSMLHTLSDVVALTFAHLDSTLHALELPRVIQDEVVSYLARDSQRRDTDWPQPPPQPKAGLKNVMGQVPVGESELRALLETLVRADSVNEQLTILKQIKNED